MVWAWIWQIRDSVRPKTAEVFEIIHGEDLSWYIGQFGDPLSEKLQQFGFLEVVAARDVGFVGEEIVEGSALAVLAFGPVVDGDEGNGLRLFDPLGVFLGVEAEGFGDLVVGGGTADLLLDVVDGGLELAGAGAGAARAPVHATELVEDGATDAHGGVAREGAALLGVEFTHRGDETGDADRVEVVGVDVRGQIELHAVDDVANEGEITHDEFLLIDDTRGNSLIRAPGSGGRGIHARVGCGSGGCVHRKKGGDSVIFVWAQRPPRPLWRRRGGS